jgi:signal peptidase I
VCCPHCCSHSFQTDTPQHQSKHDDATRTSSEPEREQSWARRALSRVGTGLGGLFVVAVLAATVPALFGWNSIKVLGSSMGDALPLGSIAVTREVPAADIQVGDVILFASKAGAIPTLHRVIRFETQDGKRVAVTKGDANQKEDLTPVAMNNAGSVVQYHVPYLGYLFVALASNAKLLIFMIAPLALVGVMLTPARNDDDETSSEHTATAPRTRVAAEA